MKLEKHGSRPKSLVRAKNDKQVVVVQGATIHLLYLIFSFIQPSINYT